MSVVFQFIEKVTIKNCAGLSAETVETLGREVDRIRAHENDDVFYCKMMLNAGNGWAEYPVGQFSGEEFCSEIQKNERLAVYFNGEYTWTADRVDMEDPGFALDQFFCGCADDVFENLSFEFYNYADGSDSFGELTQYGIREDGVVFKGKAEYEEVNEIPEATWINQLFTAGILSSDLPDDCDPERVNAAVNRLNATEYYPQTIMDDFRDEDAEVFINQPRIETKAEQKEFLAALEEARVATNGSLVIDHPEFVDASTVNVRMLMIDMDRDTGALRYYMTKEV